MFFPSFCIFLVWEGLRGLEIRSFAPATQAVLLYFIDPKIVSSSLWRALSRKFIPSANIVPGVVWSALVYCLLCLHLHTSPS